MWGAGGGGGVVSEFSVAWVKRGGGGQGREGVQLPDSLMYEDSMIIAQVCLRLATIKGHSKMCSFTVLGGLGGSENQSVSGVTTICLMQRNTSPSHRVDQVVDCGLWNVGPLLFNGCAKLLDIGRNWNMLLYSPIQSIPNMLNG